MRVAHVSRTRSFGGAEIQVLRSARAQLEAGAVPTVVTWADAPLAAAARAAGVDVLEATSRADRPRGFDLIHVHEARDVPFALVWSCRGPVVVTRHLAASPRRRRDPYHAALARRIPFVAASRFVRDRLREAYGPVARGVTVIPYGLDGERRPVRPGRVGPSAASDRRALGVVARLTPRKDLRDAIDVVAVVAAQGHDVCLRVAGEETTPGVRGALLRYAHLRGVADRVELLGHRCDVPRLLTTFALLLHPTRAESFGLAPLEAMAAAVPVVGVAGGGIPEVVAHGITGLLAPPGDLDALAAAVASMLADDARAARMGRAGRGQALARFGAEREATSLLALYRRVIDGGGRT